MSMRTMSLSLCKIQGFPCIEKANSRLFNVFSMGVETLDILQYGLCYEHLSPSSISI